MGAAHGLHSNVVVNLKASEAVALADVVRDLHALTPDAQAAIEKVLATAERAQAPWEERR